MLRKLKARLRAWLIDLVREAIRIERAAATQPTMPNKNDALECMFYPERYAGKAASKPVTATSIEVGEKSFEQMQAEALAAQAKHYEQVAP